MIKKQTVLKAGDNSGIRLVKCIQIYNSQVGHINSFILVAIKNVKSYDKIKKGDLFKSIIIRLKSKKHRKTGHSILFYSIQRKYYCSIK